MQDRACEQSERTTHACAIRVCPRVSLQVSRSWNDYRCMVYTDIGESILLGVCVCVYVCACAV
jgi:hypothetical protein